MNRLLAFISNFRNLNITCNFIYKKKNSPKKDPNAHETASRQEVRNNLVIIKQIFQEIHLYLKFKLNLRLCHKAVVLAPGKCFDATLFSSQMLLRTSHHAGLCSRMWSSVPPLLLGPAPHPTSLLSSQAWARSVLKMSCSRADPGHSLQRSRGLRSGARPGEAASSMLLLF